MKLFTGWIMSAGLVMAATSAQAQILQAPVQLMQAPVEIAGGLVSMVSDVGGPYAAMPPEAAGPGYAPGYGPALLPPMEVYTVVREMGFSPLGVPHQRGFVYTIAVIDRRGDDGRLVIDARDGRVIRFVPAYRISDNSSDDVPVIRGPQGYGPQGPLPPINPMRGEPRPPASVPHVASRTPTVPLPKASPPRADEAKQLSAKPATEAPKPPQQSAAVVKPAETAPAPQASAPPAASALPAEVAAKPAQPQILPTQEMPKVQGLD